MALHLEKKAKGEKSWDDEEQVKNSQKQNRKKNPTSKYMVLSAIF